MVRNYQGNTLGLCLEFRIMFTIKILVVKFSHFVVSLSELPLLRNHDFISFLHLTKSQL